MAQYFILNQHSGELMGEYEDVDIANEACSSLTLIYLTSLTNIIKCSMRRVMKRG